MFAGQQIRLSREEIAQLLGPPLSDRHLHYDVYGDAEPPRRSKVRGNPLLLEEASAIFRQGYCERLPSELTPLADSLHQAMAKSLLPRVGSRAAHEPIAAPSESPSPEDQILCG